MTATDVTGEWIDNHGREAFVIQRESGGVRVEYKDSWTCCDADTWEQWKSYGWTRVSEPIRSKPKAS